jgi:hypothetical protein
MDKENMVIYTMDIKKNEMMLFAGMWMELKKNR